MNKDRFKDLSARGGGSLEEKINQLGSAHKTESLEDFKVHTLRIRQSHIERIKDYVYEQKYAGKPFITQGDVIDQALGEFFEKVGVISQRPDEMKNKERRFTGRRKKGKNDFEL